MLHLSKQHLVRAPTMSARVVLAALCLIPTLYGWAGDSPNVHSSLILNTADGETTIFRQKSVRAVSDTCVEFETTRPSFKG